jgi:hypothetical protein
VSSADVEQCGKRGDRYKLMAALNSRPCPGGSSHWCRRLHHRLDNLSDDTLPVHKRYRRRRRRRQTDRQKQNPRGRIRRLWTCNPLDQSSTPSSKHTCLNLPVIQTYIAIDALPRSYNERLAQLLTDTRLVPHFPVRPRGATCNTASNITSQSSCAAVVKP